MLGYIEMMQRAARELDAEANSLEEEPVVRPGRRLDITI